MVQAILSWGAAIGLSVLLPGSAGSTPEAVRAALKTRLPKTDINSIDCARVPGLCEVLAGDNLFYVTSSARFLVIGRVYDMETRQDLTAARLLELNPDLLVGGSAQMRGQTAQGARLAPRDASANRTVDLSGLSSAGAITWGKGAHKVTVFSDFHCGYCRALAAALDKMDVTVIERPISVLGSRQTANQVLCARDRAGAVRAAYAGSPIGSRGDCDTRGLDENERFARAQGFTGTPVIIRSDGAVLEGYRPPAALIAWLKEAKS